MPNLLLESREFTDQDYRAIRLWVHHHDGNGKNKKRPFAIPLEQLRFLDKNELREMAHRYFVIHAQYSQSETSPTYRKLWGELKTK